MTQCFCVSLNIIAISLHSIFRSPSSARPAVLENSKRGDWCLAQMVGTARPSQGPPRSGGDCRWAGPTSSRAGEASGAGTGSARYHHPGSPRETLSGLNSFVLISPGKRIAFPVAVTVSAVMLSPGGTPAPRRAGLIDGVPGRGPCARGCGRA